MNIPQIYLIEPYNAYAPKGRKKHWHEVVEEQALMARIIAEQQAQQQALLEAQSKTLPPNSPDISAPTVGNAAAGGGGVPVFSYFHPAADVVEFSSTPSFGAAPLTVQFVNLTSTQQYDSYTWDFGDGTTSTDINPPLHVYHTSSTTYLVQLTSSQQGNEYYASHSISASVPIVTAAFTFTTTSNATPFSVSFTNTSTDTANTPAVPTYLWTFQYNNGKTATTTTQTTASTTNFAIRVDSGSFTASLQATGSYQIASKSTSTMVTALAPTLAAAFTYTSASNTGPETFTFTNASAATYNGFGSLIYLWEFGDTGTGSVATSPVHLYATSSLGLAGSGTGSFTASLQVTESGLYRIAAKRTASFFIPAPTLTATLIVTSGSDTAPTLVTLSRTLNHNGSGQITYLWTYGTGSGVNSTSSLTIPPSLAYSSSGAYTASLQVTESNYNIAYRTASMFDLL